MVRRLTGDERRLLGMRVRAQLLDEPAPSPADAVGWMLAMQAQDWFGALWAVAQRSAPGTTTADVEAAQAGGAIVRSWPMRGTLHWTRAEDIRWLATLTADRVDRRDATRMRSLGLDEEALVRSRAVVERALADGPASRQALLDALVAAGQPVDAQRGPHILGWLARHGHVVMTSRTDYALHDAWVATPRALDGDEALEELARRYLLSHGPATVHDLAWWAGLTVADARRGVDAVRDELDAWEVAGTTYLHAPGLEPAAGVLLVAPFDELVLGYADRSITLRGEPLERIVPGANGMFLPAVVVDGAVVGTWRRTTTASSIRVAVEPWTPVPARQGPALRRAVRAYGTANGMPAALD
ncbi:winged helix DNA-binding domain-containing protein [Agrococcus sp. SGAir0287]|uniref:winged helix DNA-binding domain-containing protein n=1 Tax=Agrococcus sp. SGAir0287 TaxID=2070347 RepID=UPI001586F1C1|nr:winged helix DNA-binding domain-containing protein [Agrococcus sp. SGAir0287]